jgi:hypothetical protein
MTEEELSGSDKETMPEAELFASDDEAEAHEYARRTCARTYVRTQKYRTHEAQVREP